MSPLRSMEEPTALAGVVAAGRRRARHRTLVVVVPALAGAVLLLAASRAWPVAAAGVAGGALAVLGLIGGQLWRIWHEPAAAVARRLNHAHPVLEDSAALLLRPAAELNLLERLQQQRLLDRLPPLAAAGPLLPVNFRASLLAAGLLLGLAALVWAQYPSGTAWPAPPAAAPVPMRFSAPPIIPAAAPQLAATRLRVQPPTYTHRRAFVPAQASFRCPRESRVRWRVTLSRPSKTAPVLELGSRRLPLRPLPGDSTGFEVEAQLLTSTLYRLRLGSQVSDDYSIDVVPDQAPVIHLVTPKAFTLIAFGQPPQVVIRAQLRDDYGLTRARLVATVAQGEGEAVKFREVTTDLSAGLGGQPITASLRAEFNLRALGLTYGDEVYFYLQAWDNHRHLTRSDTYLVQWADTAVQTNTLDASLGVSTAPAYFRSQRQIIIDTEKLLAEQTQLHLPTITVQERANTIGVDQKMLRMRYGKFLGEEIDESIGGATRPDDDATPPAEPPGLGSVVAEDHLVPASATPVAAKETHTPNDGHDHAHGLPTPAGQSAAEARTAELLEPYIHHHDDAETADFLEPAVKAKLQAVLSQMWESELRLRTGRPREALPFEYRALRLLKQVQQQTRAYVKKAGFTPPPMPEATTRLTGDLAGAVAPRRQRQLVAPAHQPTIRAALAVLRRLRGAAAPPSEAAATLERAGPELARAALQRPGRYLTALRVLRGLTATLRAGQLVNKAALPPLERAFTDLLPPPPPAPASRSVPASQLARRYFEQLN